MRIWLDAGHGGEDTGAIGPSTTKESDINLEIVKNLGKLLKNSGHEVGYTRLDDTFFELGDRAKMANDWLAELFISVHCNSYKDPMANGIETFSYNKGKSSIIAQDVQKKLVQYLGLTNRGVKTANFAVLRLTDMPAILIETAFISNVKEESLLSNSSFREKAAIAIFEGVTRTSANDISYIPTTEQTVMQLDNIWVQEMTKKTFGIMSCNCTKREVPLANYFNLGFFATLKGGDTIPVGNLAIDGKVLSQSCDNESWINLSKKYLTTIYTTDLGVVITRLNKLDNVPGLRFAISGIPIIINGKRITIEEIKSEGYFGSELSNTWHGFLGIRGDKIVYVAMKCGFDDMCWNLVALGIYNAIKVDGGGSFILHNGKELVSTSENRVINNVGMWE